jgi:glycosyltransferase involved in cell wall biosynthesis
MKIGLIGTRGVPATYGGFETCVEEVGARLADRGHDVVVYCRKSDRARREYRGMRLVHLPTVPIQSLETLSHSMLSALHASASGFDCAIMFNAANAPCLPFLRMPVAVNTDGLEWKRGKWGPKGRRYLRWAEGRTVRWSDRVIADAFAIKEYLDSEYETDAVYIPYGAPILSAGSMGPHSNAAVPSRGFHLLVARFEPENSVDLMLKGYLESGADLPLIVIGDTPYKTAYREKCVDLIGLSSSIVHLGAVYDQDLLNWYYANCLTYLDGHTVGGTSPSLVRAMGAGAAVISRAIIFSHEVLGTDGWFYGDAAELGALIAAAEDDKPQTRARGEQLRERATALYRWEDVADAYERLCVELTAPNSTPQPIEPSEVL